MADSKGALNREIGDLVGVLKNLPPPPTLVVPESREECLCGKMVSPLVFSPLDTGVIVVVNNVCRGCKEGEREDAKLARLVCVKCKQVVARMKPHRDADGFSYEAGCSYHLEMCGGCSKGLEKSIIIEKRIWESKVRLARVS